MGILYHPGKSNIVVDPFSKVFIGNTSHVEEELKERVAKDMHRIARLGVRLIDSITGGVVVMNGVELSLLFEVKEKQNQDPIFL